MNKIVLLFIIVIFAFYGCSDENSTNPATNQIPETNLFPLTPGNLLVFDSYLVDTSRNRVESTKIRSVTYAWRDTLLGGKQGIAVIDSNVYTFTGTIERAVTNFLRIEGGDLYTYTGSAWIPFFKKSAGLNATYVIGQDSLVVQGFPVPIPATLTGRIAPKEPITTPLGTFEAYRLEITATAQIGLGVVTVVEYYYVANNVGIVRQFRPFLEIPSLLSLPGREILLVSKNF